MPGGGAWFALTADRFQIGASDAILLADSNGLQSPAAHVAAHGPNMQSQSLRDLLKGIQMGFVRHMLKTGK
jgi:hypothetical protein